MKTTWFVAVLCAAACAGSSKTAPLDDLRTRANEIRMETIAHGDAVGNAGSLGEIAALEMDHREATDKQIDAMHGDVEDMMMSCGSSMMASLDGAVDDLSGECDRHEQAMAAANSLGVAWNEETVHQSHMKRMLDAMSALTGPDCSSMKH